MFDLQTVKELGFPIVTAVALAWWARLQAKQLKDAYEARIAALEGLAKQQSSVVAKQEQKIEELNVYIRDEQAEMVKEAHAREIELVHMLRERDTRRYRSGEHAVPEPQDIADAETQAILAERKAKREKHK